MTDRDPETDAARVRQIRDRLEVFHKAGWSYTPPETPGAWDGFAWSARVFYAEAVKDIPWLLDQFDRALRERDAIDKDYGVLLAESQAEAGQLVARAEAAERERDATAVSLRIEIDHAHKLEASHAALVSALREIQEGCELASRRLQAKTGNPKLDAERRGAAEAYFTTARKFDHLLAPSSAPGEEQDHQEPTQ